MNYILQFLLPVIVFASGLVKDTNTYIAPNSPVLEQKASLPTLTLNSQPRVAQQATEPIKTKPVDINCSCVLYAENITGVKIKLDAIDYPINTITPQKGDLIKLQYYNATTTKYIYHLSVIKEITEEGYAITEANFEKCKAGERIIPKDDKHILGFFNPERQRLIDELTPIQRETLWNESGWSMYDTKGAVLRGKDGEWGLIQIMPQTLNWLTEKRRIEKVYPILLDKMSFEDQIILFKYGWSKNVKWYGTPDIVSSTD